MSREIDYQAELDRLHAQRSALRNEYMEAVRQQDVLHVPSPGAENGPPPVRPLPAIDADLAKVDRLIDDTTRAQEQARIVVVEPRLGLVADALPEVVEQVAALKDVVLHGALGGPVGQQFKMAVEHVEMQLGNRAMLVEALADAHVNSKEVEKENALLDEIRRVDLDPELGKTLAAVDEKFELKKQGLEDKIATLQTKFDERHADKSADDKLQLQATLDKQFDELRAQLEKAQEQERQRALDEQMRATQRLNEFRDVR